jgi:hypothetical protein
VILRRRDAVSIAAVAVQSRERQRFVAVLVVDAEKPQRRSGKQFVDTGLDVGAHVAGKRSRGRYQSIERNAGEMKSQCLVSISKMLLVDHLGQTACDLVHAFIADGRQIAFQ